MSAGRGTGPRLQPIVRARLRRMGGPGERWVAALPGLLADLEQRWEVRIDPRSLPGGSNGLVAAAQTRDGAARVVKVALPGTDLARQAAVLVGADGRGQVRLHAHDPRRQALLLDRLGRSLSQTPTVPEDALDLLCATLREAWAATAAMDPGQSGRGGRAAVLGSLVRRLSREVPEETDPAVLEHARALAAELASRHDPDAEIVAHGDAHPANLLRAPDASTGWLLVDPEGPGAEAAYDVGIALRDWSSHLQDPATAADRLRAWCERAARATGTDADRVWAWAYLERVRTGLWVTSLGSPVVGRPFLTAASALLGGRGAAGTRGSAGPDPADPDRTTGV